MLLGTISNIPSDLRLAYKPVIFETPIWFTSVFKPSGRRPQVLCVSSSLDPCRQTVLALSCVGGEG